MKINFKFFFLLLFFFSISKAQEHSHFEELLKELDQYYDKHREYDLSKINSAHFYLQRSEIRKTLNQSEKSIQDHTSAIQLLYLQIADSYKSRAFLKKSQGNFQGAIEDLKESILLHQQKSYSEIDFSELIYYHSFDYSLNESVLARILLDVRSRDYISALSRLEKVLTRLKSKGSTNNDKIKKTCKKIEFFLCSKVEAEYDLFRTYYEPPADQLRRVLEELLQNTDQTLNSSEKRSLDTPEEELEEKVSLSQKKEELEELKAFFYLEPLVAPQLSEIFWRLGSFLFFQGNKEKAMEYYQKSLSVFPLPETYYFRAKALEDLQKWEEAEQDYSDVIRCFGEKNLFLAYSYFQRAKIKYLQNDYSQAKEDFQKYFELIGKLSTPQINEQKEFIFEKFPEFKNNK
jgi:tetratricopeptide (TPR) repeat protein